MNRPASIPSTPPRPPRLTGLDGHESGSEWAIRRERHRHGHQQVRIVVLGTGDFALPMFDHLCETGHQVLALVTQPDRPQGRKQELIPSLIKQSALRRGIEVFQPENVNAAEGLDRIRQLAPDLLVTAAYGQILSADLLGPSPGRHQPPRLDPARLPRRGARGPGDPERRDRDRRDGHPDDPRIDAGGMIAFARTAIDPDETAGELEDRLARLGAPLVAESIAAVAAGTARSSLRTGRR